MLALIAGVRSPILLSILAAFSAAACSQSLTPNMFGTGGIPAGSGGTGGRGVSGTGGVDGGLSTATCDELATEYLTAVSLAGDCQVGAPGQCQQLVISSLYPCAGCSTYVNDGTALTAIRNAWDQARCVGVVPPCGLSACPAPLNNTCVSIDGGSSGYCEYLPQTGTGAAGATGAGGTGGSGGGRGTGGISGAGGSSDGGVGPGPLGAILYPDPYMAGDYLLAVSNVPLSCDDTMPTPPCSLAGVTFVMDIQLAPSDLFAGAHSLSDLAGSSYSEMGPNPGESFCWGGFGGGVEGSLDISSVTNTTVVFQIQDTFAADFDVNGVPLTALRCPGATGSISTL